jgi:hypothetical protein
VLRLAFPVCPVVIAHPSLLGHRQRQRDDDLRHAAHVVPYLQCVGSGAIVSWHGEMFGEHRALVLTRAGWNPP